MGIKNLIIVTSVISAPPGSSVYTDEERLEQLGNTIDTIHQKIPNPLIFLINGGELTESMFAECSQLKVDYFLTAPLFALNKSVGEVYLIYSLLVSDIFTKVLSETEIHKVTKISGRYFLKDEFVYDETDETIVKIVEPTESWSGHGVCETRYYSFSASMLSQFKDSLQRILEEGIFIDIEHTFYKNRVLPIDKSTKKLNLAGHLAPTGVYVED